MRSFIGFIAVLIVGSIAFAEPAVVVLTFDAVMDSVYGYYGEKQSVLNYRIALQQMITTDLGKYEQIRVIELNDLSNAISKLKIDAKSWNDPKLAALIANEVKADYAIIGTYGEYTKQIRVDARIVPAATGDVPPGYTVTATTSLWDDLPTAASRIVSGILPIITASGTLRPTSKGVLFPEGDLSAYDPNGTTIPGTARLVILVNAPAPAINTTPLAEFKRCDRIDLMNIPKEQQLKEACRFAVVPTGQIKLRVAQRGFLPYEDVLDLAAGKAYRLEVNLKPVEQLPK